MRRAFVRLTFGLLALFFCIFTLEFLLEWDRLGRPGLAALSYAGQNQNAKLVDVLSPAARAYNNILAMLIATIGLAIPLTANMHTPKLIEMFLRDRLNRVVLIASAFGAANVIFVDYMIGPAFAPVWAIRFAIFGVLIGWTVLIPYFFYVVRFIDPSNILMRLKLRCLEMVGWVESGRIGSERAQDSVRDHTNQIGTIILKSLDRGDRVVAVEAFWHLKLLLASYGTVKKRMPPEWFHVDRRDFVGLSQEAIDFLNRDRTFFEMMVLTQLRLSYRQALSKSPDLVSTLADAMRKITLDAAANDDQPATQLAVRHFNNFLRDSIRAHAPLAFYDVLHEYRRLAAELPSHPLIPITIARRIRYYTEEAARAAMPVVPQLATFDLDGIARAVYQAGNPNATAVLDLVLAMSHHVTGGLEPMVIKAKMMLGGWFVQTSREPEAERVRRNLSDVPAELIAHAEQELLATEQSYFEVTDRQMAVDYVPPEGREPLSAFAASLVQQSVVD